MNASAVFSSAKKSVNLVPAYEAMILEHSTRYLCTMTTVNLKSGSVSAPLICGDGGQSFLLTLLPNQYDSVRVSLKLPSSGMYMTHVFNIRCTSAVYSVWVVPRHCGGICVLRVCLREWHCLQIRNGCTEYK